MFGFDRDEDGSEERWREDRRRARIGSARARHVFWWVIHNCVAHPLIGIVPIRPMFQLHDWTSRKMHP